MGKYYEKKVLIEALQLKAKALGRVPAPEDMTAPPAQAYLGFFKKWDRAVKAAGIQILLAAPAQEQPTQAAPEAPQAIETAAKAVIKPVLDAAALPNRRRYSKRIITQMLLDEFKRLGKKPTRKEIDENKELPTVSTCLNYFGTTRIGDVWDEILEDL